MREFLDRRAVRVVGVVVLFVVGVVLLFLVLNWYVAPRKPSVRKDLVLAVAQILGGTALLVGLYITWRTLQVNREGQITERFTRAIDQLGKVDDKGHKLLEVRIGGIYALEKIGEDSDVYYWPIIEILSAYVRTNAPWPTKEKDKEKEASESSAASDHEDDLKAGEERSHQHRWLDIQAILDILRNRKHHYDNGEDDFIRLTDTDLRYADLREIHWESARLRGANLKAARLGSAHLSRARLRNTIFEEAELEEAQLQGADLEEAILCKAKLQGANLQEADLRKADLRGVNLVGTVDLTQEQIEDAIGNEATRLPENLHTPAMWSKDLDEQRMILKKSFSSGSE